MNTGFSMYGLSLWSTIMSAYFPMKFWSNDRLQGAPAWVGKENYDIEAKFDEPTAEQFRNMTVAQRQELVRPMLQALLADRCKLVLHTVPAETPAFALVVGKHGVNAKELNLSTPGQPIASDLVHLYEGGFMEPVNGKLIFFQTPMASLVDFLSRSSPRPLLDQTGLPGKYDFTLTRLEDMGASPNDPEPPTHWKVEDLGLSIKAAKAQTVTLVIEHIDRPSAN